MLGKATVSLTVLPLPDHRNLCTVTSGLDYYNLLYFGLPWKLSTGPEWMAWVLMRMPWTAYIQAVLR